MWIIEEIFVTYLSLSILLIMTLFSLKVSHIISSGMRWMSLVYLPLDYIILYVLLKYKCLLLSAIFCNITEFGLVQGVLHKLYFLSPSKVVLFLTSHSLMMNLFCDFTLRFTRHNKYYRVYFVINVTVCLTHPAITYVSSHRNYNATIVTSSWHHSIIHCVQMS